MVFVMKAALGIINSSMVHSTGSGIERLLPCSCTHHAGKNYCRPTYVVRGSPIVPVAEFSSLSSYKQQGNQHQGYRCSGGQHAAHLDNGC